MSDDVISLNGFKESKLCVSLEITDLIFNFTNNLNISCIKLHLSIHIKLIGNLSEGVSDQDHLVFRKVVFEINAAGMPYEEGDLALVVNALDVNLSVNLSVARIRNNLVVLRTLIILID